MVGHLLLDYLKTRLRMTLKLTRYGHSTTLRYVVLPSNLWKREAGNFFILNNRWNSYRSYIKRRLIMKLLLGPGKTYGTCGLLCETGVVVIRRNFLAGLELGPKSEWRNSALRQPSTSFGVLVRSKWGMVIWFYFFLPWPTRSDFYSKTYLSLL